ncbi:unnamed protein product, partial [Medioppia subpectinata]
MVKMLANIPGPASRLPLIGNLDMIWHNCNTEYAVVDYVIKGLAKLYRK